MQAFVQKKETQRDDVIERGRALAKDMRKKGTHVYCKNFTPTASSEGCRILNEYMENRNTLKNKKGDVK